jgi:hypothetical protein
MTALKHLAAGEATDPAVAPLLTELQQQFDAAGITRITAFDACVMTKAPLTDGPDPDRDKTRPIAIPPRHLWAGFVASAKEVDTVLVEELADIEVRVTGYRPADYNKAVGGAGDSSHVRATAFDVWVSRAVILAYYNADTDAEQDAAAAVLQEHRRRIKLAFARRFIAGGKVGFGVYTNDIHVDFNDLRGRRTWGDATEWAKKARAAA